MSVLTTNASNAMNQTINSIGNNFKGVMFCNRPDECDRVPILASSRSENPNNNNAGSFICGTVKKPWGRNVVISEKSRVLCRLSYKNSALSKHKKWLSDLQKERELSELGEKEELRAKDAQMRQFKQREARKRERVLSLSVEDNSSSPEHEESGSEGEYERETLSGPQHARSVETDESYGERCKPKKQHKNQQYDESVNLLLPAWALTESKTELAKETSVQLEHDELLAFVDGLNFHKFESDLELGSLMNQVKERIKCLEKEKRKDEARLRAIEESEKAAEKSSEFNKVDVFDAMKPEELLMARHGDENDDVRSIADTVISSRNGLMGYIHSRKSAEALVNQGRERFLSNKHEYTSLATVVEEQVVVEERTCSPPAMVTHKDDEGARLAVMKSLQKLPFMNRNPAI